MPSRSSSKQLLTGAFDCLRTAGSSGARRLTCEIPGVVAPSSRRRVGCPDDLELLEATQQRLRSGTDSRIVPTISFAGERAFAVVAETATGRELDRTVYALPAEPLCAFEVHALLEDEEPPTAVIAG